MKSLIAKTDILFDQFEIFAIKVAEKQRKYVIFLITLKLVYIGFYIQTLKSIGVN